MILTIARKEWTERVRDGQFRWTAAAAVLLLTVSAGAGFVSWKQNRDIRQAAQERDRRQWLNQGPRNPHSAAHFGVYAFKAPAALLPRHRHGQLYRRSDLG
jgi:ABC-2 type transport system permease protein